MARTNWMETASALVIGIGVGTAIGLLFAPRSGQKTRDYLAGSAQDKLDEAVATGQKWANLVQQRVNEAKEQIRGAAEAGERAYRQAENAS
jgi:gas vesicle protein